MNHLLLASDYHQINQILESIGKKMVRDGRHESINYWITQVPASIRMNYPYMVFLLAEVNRYLGHLRKRSNIITRLSGSIANGIITWAFRRH